MLALWPHCICVCNKKWRITFFFQMIFGYSLHNNVGSIFRIFATRAGLAWGPQQNSTHTKHSTLTESQTQRKPFLPIANQMWMRFIHRLELLVSFFCVFILFWFICHRVYVMFYCSQSMFFFNSLIPSVLALAISWALFISMSSIYLLQFAVVLVPSFTSFYDMCCHFASSLLYFATKRIFCCYLLRLLNCSSNLKCIQNKPIIVIIYAGGAIFG